MDILVIGCGIIGLTSALSLTEAGHRVSIWARELPPHTTSNVAAAIWYPYKAYPPEKVTAWGKTALHRFKDFLPDAASGVVLRNKLEVFTEPVPDPWWVDAVDVFRHAMASELPPGYQDGYFFETVTVDTSIHLHYLMQKLQASGGQIVQRTVTDLAEAFAQFNVVINCSGLGARELVHDTDIHAARGQVVRVKHNGFRLSITDERWPAYIIPRINDIVLGGTYEEYNEDTTIVSRETEDILRHCAALAPEFAAIMPDDIIGVACGLRPVRSAIRLEVEHMVEDRFVVHNYGHGGSGITLSWGCAAEVGRLVEENCSDL